MSEVVERFPAAAYAKYDWAAWADGQIHKCTRGEDFDADPVVFGKAAYRWADRHDHKAQVSVQGDVVYVQFKVGREKRRGPTLGRQLRRVS